MSEYSYPAGVHALSEPLVLRSGDRLVGEGRGVTVLTGYGVVVESARGVSIEGVTVRGVFRAFDICDSTDVWLVHCEAQQSRQFGFVLRCSYRVLFSTATRMGHTSTASSYCNAVANGL